MYMSAGRLAQAYIVTQIGQLVSGFARAARLCREDVLVKMIFRSLFLSISMYLYKHTYGRTDNYTRKS